MSAAVPTVIPPITNIRFQLKIENLLQSSRGSWTVTAPEGGPLTPDGLNRKPESRVGPFPLAILAQGQFADAFEGKQMPSWPKETSPAVDGMPAPAAAGTETDTRPAVAPMPAKLLLIGAATPFQKNLLRSGGHLNFLLNSVDALTLGDELVTIRSKQPIDRSMGRVSAASKIAWRFFVTLVIPILIAAIGFLRVLWRRQAKQSYLKSLELASV